MAMKNTFDLKRFGKYFLYDLRQAWTRYGILFLTLALFPVIYFVLTGSLGLLLGKAWHFPGEMERAFFYTCVLLVFLMTMPIVVYGFLTERQAGASWLLLPASRLEKYVSMLGVVLLVMPVAFMLIYAVADALLCACFPALGEPMSGRDWWTVNAENVVQSDVVRFTKTGLWLGTFLGNSCILLFFLLGGLVFKRRKGAKTLLTLMALVSAGVLTAIGAVYLVIKHDGGMDAARLMEHPDRLEFWINFLLHLLTTVPCVLLLVGTWFRLKTLKH